MYLDRPELRYERPPPRLSARALSQQVQIYPENESSYTESYNSSSDGYVDEELDEAVRVVGLA